MRASRGRAVAVAVAALAVVLAAVLVLRGHGGDPPAAGAGPASRSAPRVTGTVAGPGTPAQRSRAASPARHADPFGAAAASLAASRSGSVLAAVYDVRTGQSWRFGDGPPQAEASVVKLDILETLLARNGAAALPAGQRDLAQTMIEDSDNDAATSLWDADDGAAGLTAYDERAGLTRTVPSPCVACAGFAWPGWGLTTTVPGDQLTLLKQLVVPGAHPLLSAAQRSYALSLMENVTSDQRWGVSGGVPAGVSVALKDGWLPLDDADTNWQVNSVGWVSGDGRDYLIAVLTTGNPTEQYGIDTINALSAGIWSALR
jgi:hypothetical protein